MFATPVLKATPDKAPEAFRRKTHANAKARRSLDLTGAVQSPEMLQRQNANVGTFVKGYKTNRIGDTGVILAKAVDTVTVAWLSDSLQEDLHIRQLTLLASNSGKAPAKTAVPAAPINTSHKHSAIISSRLPKGIYQSCPLNSQDPIETETFQLLADNFMCDSHPNVEKVILGHLDNPL